jgi:hypothetical protein
VKFAFDVGEIDRHQVDFSWSQFLGLLRITVDANVVRRAVAITSPVSWSSRQATHSPEMWNVLGSRIVVRLVRRWTFQVGSEERHAVIIEKERGRMLSGWRPQKYRVFVDGQLILERSGY